MHFDAANFGMRRTLAQKMQQVLEVAFNTLGDDFDAAITNVFGVTTQVQNFGLALSESSVPNALHFTVNERCQAQLFLWNVHPISL